MSTHERIQRELDLLKTRFTFDYQPDGQWVRILTSVGMEPRINAASVPDPGAVSRRPTVRYLRARRASVQ